jgi:hypothetical protein
MSDGPINFANPRLFLCTQLGGDGAIGALPLHLLSVNSAPLKWG